MVEKETEGARGKERPRNIKMRQEAERSRHSEQDPVGLWERQRWRRPGRDISSGGERQAPHGKEVFGVQGRQGGDGGKI